MIEEQDNSPKIVAAVSSGAGVVAGGAATSGIAMGATGAGGLTGYLLGASAVIGEITCGAVAATAAATLVAGPVPGGLAGYGIYRGVKKVVRG